MKRMIGLGIVAFWLVMIGLLIQRNLPEPSSSSPLSFSEVALDGEAAPGDKEEKEDQEEWMGVYHQDQKVGYIRRRLTPTDTGYVWDEQWRMRLNVMDTLQTVHTVVHANVDQQYALNDFSFRMLSSGVTFQVKGHVVHKEDASNGSPSQELQGEMTTGGNTSSFSFPLTRVLPM